MRLMVAAQQLLDRHDPFQESWYQTPTVEANTHTPLCSSALDSTPHLFWRGDIGSHPGRCTTHRRTQSGGSRHVLSS